MKRGFFEYLGLADMEKMHSQMLAWLLSENCSVFDSLQKEKLIMFMSNTSCIGNIQKIHTEHKNIDVLVETDTEWLVIENKLKSSQHSNQLEKYQKTMLDLANGKAVHYIFLTLVAEKASSPWINFSYKELVGIISGFDLIKSRDTDRIIFDEYFSYLKRLAEVVDLFLKSPSEYPNVFTDGHMKKLDKASLGYTDVKKFISENQLETVLQKCYFASLVDRLAMVHPDFDFSIAETHGVALINAFEKKEIKYLGKLYKIGIQFQGGTWKFAMSVSTDYLKSDKNWMTHIFPIFQQFKTEKRNGYTQYNGPDKKAWVSVSKKMATNIYQMAAGDFIKEYSSEIVHAKNFKKIIGDLIHIDGHEL